mgnify:CR=1 FL=1
MGYKTEQEEFWSGKFGDEYIERNMFRRSFSNSDRNIFKDSK